MSRRHHRKGPKEPPELDITTFLNLMVVLVPFLLITAVFSRVTILELNMPTASAGGASGDKPKLTLEVVVRKTGLEIENGKSILATIPKLEDKYDIPKLRQLLLQLKNDYPDKTDATVLMEPDIEYEYLVKVMDALRSAEVKVDGQDEPQKLALFPDISIGDAP